MKNSKSRLRYFRLIKPSRSGRAGLRSGAIIASAAMGAALGTPLHAAEPPQRVAPSVHGTNGHYTATPAADDLAAQAPGTPVRFDIPQGPIETVLGAFTATTSIQVDAPADTVRGLTSPGVSGSFTPAEALARLLEGTSLTARFSSPTQARIELRVASESVQVTGRAPRVDSPKYATPLSSTPQTIQVIPRALMEQQGVTTLSEALRNVPGITLQAGEGGGSSSTSGDMFTMRGFSANNSLFVDGVRDDGLIARDTFNMEQVEVFLGPTGSDVGRGTAAGYVNMATKAPRLASSATGNLQLGSASQQRLTIDANHALPIGEPGGWLRGTAVRFNALWQDSGVPGRDEVDNERRAFAPSIALGLGTPVRIIASGQFMRQDNLPDYGIPTAAWHEPVNLATPTNLASQPVDQSNYYGSVDYDYDKVAQDSYLARAEFDITPSLTLRNQSRFNRTHRSAVVTAITGTGSFNPATEQVTFARQGNERENEIFANQTSLSSRIGSGQIRHAITAGIEFVNESQFAPTLTGMGTRAPESIYSPNPFGAIADMNVTRTGAFTEGGTDTIGAYAFDTISLGSKLQVSGGLRVERYETNYKAVDATGAVTTNAAAEDTLLSGKAGALYQIHPRGNIYLSFGTSVTPPGTANFTLSTNPNNANNPNVDPQRSANIEVGSKWDLADGRLSTTIAIFRTKNENVIYTIDSTTVPPLFNQDDGQLVRGVSLGASGQLLPRWGLTGNFAYLSSEVDTQNPANDGNRLTLTPVWSGSLWTTYALPFKLTFGGGIRYQGETFYNAANSLRAPSYTIVDGLVEYPVNQHLTLRLNLYNLTDEDYIRNINNNGGRYNPRLTRSVVFSTGLGF